MSIVRRKRGRTTTYYVVVTWQSKRIWEKVGSDEREAERREKRAKEEIKAGTYLPPRQRGMSVQRYADAWLAQRPKRSLDDDTLYLERFALARDWFAGMKMNDVRAPHLIKLFEDIKLQKTRRPMGKNPDGTAKAPTVVAPKSVASAYGVLRTMFKNARQRDEIDDDPFSRMPSKFVKGRVRQKRRPYELDAVRTLLSATKVPPSGYMLAAIAIFTGLRKGEVAGRTWRDWDRASSPLTALLVTTQYDRQPLKGDDDEIVRPRTVPVHPLLAVMLTAWWEYGFERVYLRPPTLDDFIVPRTFDGVSCHGRNSAYDLWRVVLEKAGVANQTMHATRHTFISLARRGGAREDVLERITHNANGSMVDQYTLFDWQLLCEVVMCLPFVAPSQTAIVALPEPVKLAIEPMILSLESVDAIVDRAHEPPVFPVAPPRIEVGRVPGNHGEVAEVNGQSTDVRPRKIPAPSTNTPSIVARVNTSHGAEPAAADPARTRTGAAEQLSLAAALAPEPTRSELLRAGVLAAADAVAGGDEKGVQQALAEAARVLDGDGEEGDR